MKCFFNNLVAVRTMELDTNRMKPAARQARRTAK
ncbi:Uncharacterised protein [uncultured Butyricicoccus sp.]|nr:Uncharacterised protein [uncultured Butyricicoccus sp.]